MKAIRVSRGTSKVRTPRKLPRLKRAHTSAVSLPLAASWSERQRYTRGQAVNGHMTETIHSQAPLPPFLLFWGASTRLLAFHSEEGEHNEFSIEAYTAEEEWVVSTSLSRTLTRRTDHSRVTICAPRPHVQTRLSSERCRPYVCVHGLCTFEDIHFFPLLSFLRGEILHRRSTQP